MTGTVVVGVSPTSGSPAALRWAAEEARLEYDEARQRWADAESAAESARKAHFARLALMSSRVRQARRSGAA